MSSKRNALNSTFMVFACVLASCTEKPGVLYFNDESLRVGSDYSETVQMGDQEFVRSTLIQAFDLNLTDNGSVYQFVNDQINRTKGFGGTCDPYSPVRRKVVSSTGAITTEMDYPELSCVGSDVSSDTSAVRNGNTITACHALVFSLSAYSKGTVSWLNSMKALGQIMKKIDPDFKVADLSNRPVADVGKPTEESIKKAYRLFYVIEDPDPAVVDALLKLGDETKEVTGTNTYWLRSWQYIILTLCSSPDWQSFSR